MIPFEFDYQIITQTNVNVTENRLAAIAICLRAKVQITLPNFGGSDAWMRN
jgi:hypothetical protein